MSLEVFAHVRGLRAALWFLAAPIRATALALASWLVMLMPMVASAQIRLAVDDVSVLEGDSGTRVALVVVRSSEPAPPGGISFDVAIVDGTADSADYDSLAGFRGEISAGFSDTQIGLVVHGDRDVELDETFFLDLSDPAGAGIEDARGMITILTDDRLPRLTIDDAVAVEGGSLQFIARLDIPAGPGGVSFDVATVDGTALGDVDYMPLPTSSIQIADGERQAALPVAALVDTLIEGEEFLRLEVANVAGAEPGALEARGTISDDAASRPVLDIADTSVIEGDSGVLPLRFQVTLSEPATQTVSVDYRSTQYEDDIAAVEGRLIFLPGQTVKIAEVPVRGDTRHEPDIYISMEIFDAVNADLGDSGADGIVYNDDTNLAILTTSFPDGQVGHSYDEGIEVSGGVQPTTLAITAGALPPGTVLLRSPHDGRYYLVETPTTAGTFPFTLTLTDDSPGPAGPFSISRDYTITITGVVPTIVLPPTTLPDGTLGDSYSEVLNPATGGTAPYLYALSAGALPGGLALSSEGRIDGTPNEPGSFDFTVTASDSSAGGPYTASQTYGLTIAALTMEPRGGELIANYASLYSLTFYARGAPGPYVFSVTGGTLPPGLSFEEGYLSGYPSAPGRYSFTVTAQSASVASAITSETYTIDVVPVPFTFFPAYLPEFNVGANYGWRITVSGGMAPIAFELAAGNLPPGMTLSAGGVLGGTPTTNGTYNATVRATDANGQSYTHAYAIVVSQKPLQLPTTPLADARYNQFYFARLEPATGGAIPYAYAVTAGALPAGMALTSDGTLRGIPGEAGEYAFEVTVTDSNTVDGPSSATQSYRLIVLASVSIRDSGVVEGDSGETAFGIEVALDAPSTQEVRVDYATTDSSASAPQDYQAQSGTLVFEPGQTRLDLQVRLNGDTDVEPDELFFVQLSNPRNAALAKSQAALAIYDDDNAFVLNPLTLPDARIWVDYDQTIELAGASGPYALAVHSGALPPGLALAVSQNNHRIVGKPTATGSYTFSIGLSGGHRAHSYTIRVDAPPAMILRSFPETLSGSQFQPFSGRIEAAGGVAPYLFSVVTGGRLPDGVILDTDGRLSGTPTENGSFVFTVSATDHVPGIPQTAIRDFSMVIAPAPLSLTPEALPLGYLDEEYGQTLTVLGGLPPYAFRLSGGALPPGLQLLGNGAIQGTPIAAGQYRFSLTASDTAQPMPSETTVEYVVDIVARPLQIDSKTLAPIKGGEAFLAVFPARGGSAPYAFAIASGSLPPGLNLASNGTLQGVPTAIGSFGFDVQVADVAGATATRTFQLDVVLPVVTIDSDLPGGQVGTPYARAVVAGGGLQPYAFTVAAGALPPGLQLDPGGAVQGVPIAAGDYTFSIAATDSNASVGPITASRAYTVRIEPSGFVFGPDALPNARTHAYYQQSFSVSYGTAPYRYALSAGFLPPGVHLSPNSGLLFGVPTSAGSYAFSITGSDSSPGGPRSYIRNYVLVVEQSPVEILPYALSEAVAGRYYNHSLIAQGGVQPYRYSVASGELPPGLTLRDDGKLLGTPTATGHFTFALQVADSDSATPLTATRDFALTVELPVVRIYTDRLNPAAVGTNYYIHMTAQGGETPYTYALTAGTLPAGMQLTTEGYLRGIPETTGSFEITITATDSSVGYGPVSGSRSYTLVVEPRTLSFEPGFLPNAAEGDPYFVKLQGRNGVAPYHFSITNGALPPGLGLADDGTISGIAGTPWGSAGFYQYQFALSITDANGVSATFPYVEILLGRSSLGMLPATLPAGTAGVTSYHQPFTAVNAAAPSAFAWESGALPNGMKFDPVTATLSGIPLETGQFPFQLRLTGADNRSIIRNYVLDIASPALTLAPGALADGAAGAAYSQIFMATGGTAPYRYTNVERDDRRLPSGLSFGEDGVLQGTPTSAGVFTFDIVATDSTGGQAASIQRTYTLTIAPPSIIVDPPTLPKALGGLDYSQALSARGGTAPYTFSISAGALSPGLELSAAGELSGTPSEVGENSFTVTATDALGFAGIRNYTLAVSVPKPIPASRVMTIAAGRTLTLDLTEGASGGPFTAAALISLSPAEAGAAKIVQAGGSYRLEFTPRHDFSGRVVATFTLSNASAASAPATVAFDVAPRPDPSRDAEAGRLLDAQTQSAQRFANTQTGNFQQRMERMHGAGEGRGFSNGLSAATQAYCPQEVGTMPGRRCERRAGDLGAAAMPQARDRDSNAAFGVWASGMIRSGNQDGRNDNASIDFETDGVSIGADYRFNDAFAFGGGLGYGRDESDIGDNGSRGEAYAFTLAIYASYSPGDRGFVDMLLGYQSLGYDLRRHVAANDSIIDGSRDGAQWFGSVSTGADIRRGNWQFTPYARMDVAKATLDGYAESGDPLYALAYGELDAETTTGNAGLRIDYRHETDRGAFSPQFRLEYQRDFKDNGAQAMRYADALSGPFYRMRSSDFDRSRLLLGAGLSFNADNGWSFRLDYRGLIGSGGDRDHGLQFEVGTRY